MRSKLFCQMLILRWFFIFIRNIWGNYLLILMYQSSSRRGLCIIGRNKIFSQAKIIIPAKSGNSTPWKNNLPSSSPRQPHVWRTPLISAGLSFHSTVEEGGDKGYSSHQIPCLPVFSPSQYCSFFKVTTFLNLLKLLHVSYPFPAPRCTGLPNTIHLTRGSHQYFHSLIFSYFLSVHKNFDYQQNMYVHKICISIEKQ